MVVHSYVFTTLEFIKPGYKVNGYTLRGSNSVNFIFGFHIIRGQLLRTRICSARNKFFPLRVDPNLGRQFFQVSKQEVTKICLPLKNVGKRWKSTQTPDQSFTGILQRCKEESRAAYFMCKKFAFCLCFNRFVFVRSCFFGEPKQN